jgi:hypothetical protein
MEDPIPGLIPFFILFCVVVLCCLYDSLRPEPPVRNLPDMPLPSVPMQGLLPYELTRNMPRWVVRLETIGGALCIPYAAVLIAAYWMHVFGVF